MKHTKIFIFSAFAAISVVVLRCIQIFFITDPKTGFFLENMEEIGTALTLFTVAMIALSSVLIFLFKKEDINPIPTNSSVLGCTALLAGLAHFIEPIISDADLTTLPSALAGLRFIMILAAGGVFCWFGIAMLRNKAFPYSLFTVLIISWVVRLMSTFISYTGMSNISENFYDVLMLITTLVFILIQGKALYGLTRGKNSRALISTGIGAVLCTTTSALPCIIVSLFSEENISHTPVDNPVTGIYTAAFITAYLVNICKNSAKNAKK